MLLDAFRQLHKLGIAKQDIVDLVHQLFQLEQFILVLASRRARHPTSPTSSDSETWLGMIGVTRSRAALAHDIDAKHWQIGRLYLQGRRFAIGLEARAESQPANQRHRFLLQPCWRSGSS